VLLEQQGLLVQVARLGRLVRPDLSDHRAQQEPPEQQDLPDRRGRPDLPVPLEQLVLVALLVLREVQVLREQLVLQVEQVQVEPPAHLVRRVLAVLQGQLVQLVALDLLDLLVSPE